MKKQIFLQRILTKRQSWPLPLHKPMSSCITDLLSVVSILMQHLPSNGCLNIQKSYGFAIG